MIRRRDIRSCWTDQRYVVQIVSMTVLNRYPRLAQVHRMERTGIGRGLCRRSDRKGIVSKLAKDR